MAVKSERSCCFTESVKKTYTICEFSPLVVYLCKDSLSLLKQGLCLLELLFTEGVYQ